MNKLTTTQRIFASGKTLVVSVPKEVKRIFGLRKGDYIEINWGEVIVRSDVKDDVTKIKEELGKEELPKLD